MRNCAAGVPAQSGRTLAFLCILVCVRVHRNMHSLLLGVGMLETFSCSSRLQSWVALFLPLHHPRMWGVLACCRAEEALPYEPRPDCTMLLPCL